MRKGTALYLAPGRLADVLGLVQVLAFDENGYLEEKRLDECLGAPASAGDWASVARQHPEFFRVRPSDAGRPIRIALLIRYTAHKVIDQTGEARRAPLDGRLVGTLFSLAVELYDKQMEQRDRWRANIPIVAAIIAAAAALAAAAIKSG